jgi:hypothetical protein
MEVCMNSNILKNVKSVLPVLFLVSVVFIFSSCAARDTIASKVLSEYSSGRIDLSGLNDFDYDKVILINEGTSNRQIRSVGFHGSLSTSPSERVILAKDQSIVYEEVLPVSASTQDKDLVTFFSGSTIRCFMVARDRAQFRTINLNIGSLYKLIFLSPVNATEVLPF